MRGPASPLSLALLQIGAAEGEGIFLTPNLELLDTVGIRSAADLAHRSKSLCRWVVCP